MLALLPHPAAANGCSATVTVTSDGDSGAGTLRQALIDVCPGGVIDFAPALTASGPATITLSTGELVVDKEMTIDGPGADLLAVSGGGASFIFQVSSIATIDGLTVRDGYGDNGGGIRNNSVLTVTEMIFTGNRTDSSGGAISNYNTLTVLDSTFDGNSAGSGGGAIASDYNRVLVVEGSVFYANSAPNGGGIYGILDEMRVTNSTFYSNTANSGTSMGGGMYAYGGQNKVINSTFYSNTAGAGGGFYAESGKNEVINSTFYSNTASVSGGAVVSFYNDLAVTNSTFSANSATNGANLYAEEGDTVILTNTIMEKPLNSDNCVYMTSPVTDGGGNIEDGTSCGFTGPSSFSNTNALMAPFQFVNNSWVLPLLPGSPAIDSGISDCPATDQRGVARPQGGRCDSGAFESRGFSLVMAGGSPQTAAIGSAFAAPLSVAVSSVYTEPVGPGGVITFTPPSSGPGLNVTTPFTATTDAAGLAASGVVIANGVAGSYGVTATLRGAEIVDATFNGVTEVVFALTNQCNSTDTVTSTTDDGAGSLRQAMRTLCPGGVIDFAPALTASGPATITLSTGELSISKDMTIDGPGADLLAVSGGNASRVFGVGEGASATIDGLTVRDGASEFGGGIRNDGVLTVTNSVLTGNIGGGILGGGGIYNDFSAVLAVEGSVFYANSAPNGGGIFSMFGPLRVVNSTFYSNTAGSGGGVMISNDDLAVINSTFSANSAGNGANLRAAGEATVALANTIVEKPLAGDNCAYTYPFTDGGGNIEDGTSCGFTDPTSFSNMDPLIAPFQFMNNTWVLALLPGSPAIDSGLSIDCPATDQRGVARPQGGRCDSGAFESRGFSLAMAGGSPQTAAIGSAFAAPLSVRISSAYTEPVGPGSIITFTPPSSGPGLNVTTPFTAATDAAGLAASGVVIANGVAGSYGVTATLGGAEIVDTAVNGVTEVVFALTNQRIPSAVTLASRPNPSTAGEPVLLTATVTSGVSGVLTPTGAVTFTADATVLGVASLNSSGAATLTVSNLVVGAFTLTVAYGGDTNFAGSTSEPVTQVVQPLPLAVNDAAGAQGGPVTIDVTANDLDPAGGGLTVVSVSAPGNGQAAIAPDGVSVIYTPAAGYTGVDSFTYVIEDANGNRDDALVAVVVTHAPEGQGKPQVQAVNPSVASSATFTTPSATVGVEAPVGFFTPTLGPKDVLFLAFTPVITPSQQTNNPPANLRFGNLEFNLSLFLNDQLLEGQTFEPPLALTIDYDPALLGGLNAETLGLWYWDGTAWSTEGIAILSNDVANHTVTISLSHLSQFAFFAAAPTGLDPGDEPLRPFNLYLPSMNK